MGEELVQGHVEHGFEKVRDSFVRGLEKAELGAAVAAYVDGRKVVDLWGGWADAGRRRPWQRDTIVATQSATKGMTATCVHRLIDEGRIDVDAPVATYWPEFSQGGKEGITVRMVLTHQAGLVFLSEPVPRAQRFDWGTMTSALARSTPGWPPGTRSEYHGGTFGYLCGEIVRRVDGRPLDAYFRDEVAGPLAADFLLRVGPDDERRCAEISGPEEMVGGSNTHAYRAAGEGSATGHGTADGLARVYAALSCGGALDGVRLLGPDTIAAACHEQRLAHADGPVPDFGLGYQRLWKVHPTLPVGTFGHTGLGGYFGLADPDRRVGFGFVMNQMGSNGAAHLLGAVYASL